MEFKFDDVGTGELWTNLANFEFDKPGTEYTFQTRLAHKNGWSDEYAGRVLEEYRRFIFLAMTAGHEVTPSEEVDQAWHLHLTYTNSYWDDLCQTTLGRPLHHRPTKGGTAETERYINLYNQTLASYTNTFSAIPPDDIWPDANTRFHKTTPGQPTASKNNVSTPGRGRKQNISTRNIALFFLLVIPSFFFFFSFGEPLVNLLFFPVAMLLAKLLLDDKSTRSGGGSAAGCGGGSGFGGGSGCGGDGGDAGCGSGCGGSGCGGGGCGSGCGGGGGCGSG